MKRIFTLSTLFLLLSCLIAKGQTTEEKNALKTFLETIHQYDNEVAAIPNYQRIVSGAEDLDAFWESPDNGITTDEDNKITQFSWSAKKLYGALSLAGLTELTSLSCHYNNLSSLDVSANTKLTRLLCYGNELSSLDVSTNTELNVLSCQDNNLSTLDVSANTKLISLNCYDNNLSSLDVSANTKLTSLSCSNNNISSLDVSENKELEILNCFNSNLSSLDVSANMELTDLFCNDNQLSSLDVSVNTKLTHLHCANSNLPTLDVSKNTELTHLYCFNNNFSTLDVSANTKLTVLSCNENQLSSLDVSKNTKLTGLYCFDNNLPFRDLLAAQTGKTTFSYAPQVLFLKVAPGQNIDMATLGLFITGKETRYLTDGETGTGTMLAENFTVPSDWAAGNTYTLNMWLENGELPDFKPAKYLKLSLTVLEEKELLKPFLETVHQYDGEPVAIPNYQRIVPAAADLDAFWASGGNGVTTNGDNKITQIIWNEKKLYGALSLLGLAELNRLDCYDNNLFSLNVSANTKLTRLSCDSNELTSLDVSANTALTILYCYDNNLSSLDISANTELTSLECYSNYLSSLDVSASTKLTDLYCSDNNLSSLDVSKNTKLTSLSCNNNNLSSLNFTKNTELSNLYCYTNNLSSLDLSANTKLTFLSCYDNNLSSLNVSANTELTDLYCSGNHLSSLDVSANTKLTTLECEDNHLSFRELLAAPVITTYTPQTLTLQVVQGQNIDMEALGLSITGKETRYLTDEETGAGTILAGAFKVPSDWTVGNTYTLNMWLENGELPAFKAGEYFKLSLTVGDAASANYHTVTLELGEGIWCDYPAGQLSLTKGDHLYLQFHTEDPALGTDDILFFIDDVETPFKVSIDGRGGSYILNPITTNHTIRIALRETEPTGNAAIAGGKVSITVESGELKVESDRPLDVAVYTITGKNVVQLRALSGSKSIALPNGIYIVRAGDVTKKVIVND